MSIRLSKSGIIFRDRAKKSGILQKVQSMIDIDFCPRISISAAVSARPVTLMYPEKGVDKWTGERGVLVYI
jgi:hypothetical protein